jgi:hypothetical protein
VEKLWALGHHFHKEGSEERSCRFYAQGGACRDLPGWVSGRSEA